MKSKELRAPSSSEDSAVVRQRVIAARERQIERFRREKTTCANAQLMPKMIRKHCAISAEGEQPLENASTRQGLSARAPERILKVVRRIAHLDACETVEPRHLSEAIQSRTLDGSSWSSVQDLRSGRPQRLSILHPTNILPPQNPKCSIDLGLAAVLPISALPWVRFGSK